MCNLLAGYLGRILKIIGNLCKILENENIIYYNKYTKKGVIL